MHFYKKKHTNSLFEDESPNKITFKRRDFLFSADVFRNFKFFFAAEAITNRLRLTLLWT